MLEENARYSEQFARERLHAAPFSGLAIVTCMDARRHVEEMLGLRTGDAHVIRNAGGLATDDAIRSLVVSQQLLGTDEILVIEHTGCGLLGLDQGGLTSRLVRATGRRAAIEFGAFGDLEVNLRAHVARLRAHPWIKQVPIHGLIYEVETGRLREVV